MGVSSRVVYGSGVTIEGMPEVQALLRSYQSPEVDKKLKVGVKAAGAVMRAAIKPLAPSGVRPGFGKGSKYAQGNLQKSVKSKTLRGTPIAVAVGPMSRMRHLAIRPTQPHDIRPKAADYLWSTGTHPFLRIGSTGGFAEVVHHPGNHAHPWVRAGIASSQARAMEAAASAIFSAVLHDPNSGGDE